MTSLKHFDLVIADFGSNNGTSEQSGIRPAVVLQNTAQNAASPTTIIAPITSVLKKTHMSSHIVLGKRFGLYKESMVLLEQIKTINQSSIIKTIGHINDESVIASINQGILKTLGISENAYNASTTEEAAV